MDTAERIVVLSDTHMPYSARHLPAAVVRALERASLILHAGDLTEMSVLETLAAFAPVEAVRGNVDSPELREILPARRELSLAGWRVGLVHGDGTTGTTLLRALSAFTKRNVHCVVFGHSHQPLVERHGDVLLVNPGSPTDKRRQPRYSFALLHPGETLEAELVYFDG